MNPLPTNKRVTFDFELLETFEAGVVLLGTEVKALRSGQGTLDGSYVVIRGKEAFLLGATIPPYQKPNARGYDPERTRKLLLTEKEILELERKSEKQGLTIVPTKWHNIGSKIKLQIAVAKGKKKQDKRESIKAREVKRDIDREMKRL